MISINTIILILLCAVIAVSLLLILIDAKKKREIKNLPFISFLIPTYNDGKSIGETLANIYKSYDPKKFEIVIVNDKSTDNTLKILAKLKRKYKFKVITNRKNMGKSRSINENFSKTKGHIVFMLDSDTFINKQSLLDMIKRLESDDKVGGVSCGYKVKNRNGFLQVMQDIEYSMLSFLQTAYNPLSSPSLWGGCMAFKRKAFLDIGKLSYNFLTEDMESALKLHEHGWKAEQTNYPVYTYVPEDFKTWYKQKLRWAGGGIQNVIAHPKIFIKNPIVVLFLLSFSLLGVAFIYDIFSNLALIALGSYNLSPILSMLVLPAICLPYMLLYEEYRENPIRVLWIIPFLAIYYPLFMIVSLIGFAKSITRYGAMAKGERAW